MKSQPSSEDRWRLGPLSPSQIRELPAAVEFVDAARAFNLRRTAAHELARRGAFPVPLLRFGNSYRARKADLLSALGLVPDGSASEVA